MQAFQNDNEGILNHPFLHGHFQASWVRLMKDEVKELAKFCAEFFTLYKSQLIWDFHEASSYTFREP